MVSSPVTSATFPNKGNELEEYIVVEKRNMKAKTATRQVWMHDIAQRALNRWIAEIRRRRHFHKNHYLFYRPSEPWRPITRHTAWRVYKKAYEAAGIRGKVGTHSCRKTFGVAAHELAEGDYTITSELLGHSNPANTKTYLNIQQKTLDDIVRRMT